MALAPMVLVLKKSFISWCSVKEAVFDYDYLNNLIIDSVFPYRNPLIFNLLNKKKNLIIPSIEMTSCNVSSYLY